MQNILTRLNQPILNGILLVIAGVFNIFAFAPYNRTRYIIFSIMLLLFVVGRFPLNLKKWRIFGYGMLYGYSFFLVQIYWIFYFLYFVINAGTWITILAIIVFPAYLGLFPALSVLVYTKIKSKSNVFNFVILFPAIWVFFEWVRGWCLGGYPWSDVGYIAVNLFCLKGYFPLIGEYGVSFICVSLISTVYFLMIHLSKNKIRNEPRRQYRIALCYLAIILIIGTSIESIQYTKPYGSPISVALIQGNIGEGIKWSDTSNSLKIYSDLVKSTKADIVMMPETGISLFEASLPKGYLNSLESYAKNNGASLVVGMPIIIDKDNNYINAAVLLTAKGRPYYAKSHLVPFGEYIPFKPILGPLYKYIALPMVGFSSGGENQKPLVAANQKLAFNICFENGFGSELIKAASNSTLMVNLSDMVWYDKTVAMDQHLQLSQARALENQRYYIQETNTSITAIIGPDGEIQSQLPVFRRLVLKDMVTGRIGVTPYEEFGNWPIIIFCILMGALSILSKKWIPAENNKD